MFVLRPMLFTHIIINSSIIYYVIVIKCAQIMVTKIYYFHHYVYEVTHDKLILEEWNWSRNLHRNSRTMPSSSLFNPFNNSVRETRWLSNSIPLPPPISMQLSTPGCTRIWGGRRIFWSFANLTRLQTFVVPGNKRWTVAINSTAGQLEYECTHIRDFDIHVKVAGEKRDMR